MDTTMFISQWLKKHNHAVSQVIGVIVCVCLVVSFTATIYVFTTYNGKMELPNILKGLLGKPTDSDDDDGGGVGSICSISVSLACPCDMMIKDSQDNRLGYVGAGPSVRELHKEIALAEVSDDGEKESYKIEEMDTIAANYLEYYITCFEDGVYTFYVKYTSITATKSVTATNVGVIDGEVHKYLINWGSDPPIVRLNIEKPGEGDDEKEITLETDTITNEMIEDADEECASCGGGEEGYKLDLNHDGFIGPGDFGFFAGCFGSSPGEDEPCKICDFNNDGVVDYGDLALFASCYGKTCDECPLCDG